MNFGHIMVKLISWILGNKRILNELSLEITNTIEEINELKTIISDYHNIERKDRKSKLSVLAAIHAKNIEIYNDASKELSKKHSSQNSSLRKIAYLLERNSSIVNSIGSNLAVFGIERIDEGIQKLLDALIKIENAKISLIKDRKNAKLDQIISDSQNALNDSLADLFHYHKNPIDLVKYLEIYRLFSKFLENSSQISLEIQLI